LLLYGGDLSRSIDGWAAMRFAFCLSVAETLVFTPVVAIRSVATMRELNLARDELDRLAGVDPLTGLLNRRGFEKAAAALAAPPEGRPPVAALVCDVDRFKQINDAYGHDFGDAALRRLANVLRDTVGERRSALGRLGGDEFVALLVGVTRNEALAFAETLRAAASAAPIERAGVRQALQISVGVAATSRGDGDVGRLIGAADAALIQAKRDGRDRVVAAGDARRAAA